MPDRVTQRDILESIVGLRGVSADLTAAGAEETPEGAPNGTVLVTARSLDKHARYLESVADELLKLIPEKVVKVPP